ncbi:MAG: phytanoyl-CoA dioxygenase family protein [Pseudomonadota bacterium]
MQLDDIISHPSKVLTQDQREDYFAQGYLAFPDLIDRAQLDCLRDAMARTVERSRALTASTEAFDLEPDHCAEAPKLRRATYLDDHEAVIWELCADSIIPDIATDLLGPNLRFREIMLNFKWARGGAEVKWHQDAPFYPHTHTGTCQFLVMLEDVGPEQGPLQLIPGSHKGPAFAHYGDDGEWTGAIRPVDLKEFDLEDAVTITGGAGTVTVHHSLMVHGSAQNASTRGRPALVIGYSAADAIPYTAPPYPSSHYGKLIRGVEPGIAHHEAMTMPLPPDWSGGYTSIFEHQEK